MEFNLQNLPQVLESTAYQEKVPLALSTEEDIDIIGVQPSEFATGVQDYLVDLDELMPEVVGDDWLEGYSQSALEKGKKLTDDKLKFITIWNSGSMVGFYNAKLLEELGKEVPATIEEYKEVAEALHEKYPEKMAGVFGGMESWICDEMMLTVLSQQSDYYNEWVYEDASLNSPEYIEALNGFKQFFDEGIFTQDVMDLDYASATEAFVNGDALVYFMGSPEYIEALNGFKQFFDEGIFTQDVMDLDYASATEAFVNGDALVYFMGSWEAPLLSEKLREQNGVELEDVGVMPLPVVKKGGKAAVRAYLDCGMGIVATSEKQEAAAKFLEFCSVGDGVPLLAKQFAGVPNVADFEMDETMLGTEAEKEGWKLLVDLLQNATADRKNESAFASAVEGPCVQAVINGTMTAEEAAEKMDAEWTSGNY